MKESIQYENRISKEAETFKGKSHHTWIIIVLFSVSLIGFIFLIYSFPKFTEYLH